MLTIFGQPNRTNRFCDGLSRRNFLQVGGLMFGGLTLPELLAAESQAGTGRSHKAVIMIFLAGGPPHQDTFDLKTEAPSEIRGPFRPIQTNVPGIQICEHLPRMARMMDRLALIRSIVGATGRHDAFQCLSGYRADRQAAGGTPALGAWLSKLHGSVHPGIPPHLSLFYRKTLHEPWGDPGTGGFLGMGHSPFSLDRGQGEGLKASDMVLGDIKLERLGDRRRLLQSFDTFRRAADASGQMQGMDAFREQALGILTSSRLLDALDLTKEDPRLVERYGRGDPNFRHGGAPMLTENFLIARRLVEAGARVVTLNMGFWDYHEKNFELSAIDMPILDRGFTALVEDLHQRGMDRDVSVIAWGEFGRSPTVNENGGRDHWPQVSCALMAGGGMRTGQTIGSTDRLGGSVDDRPISFQEVFATLYRNLGIRLDSVREFDLRGRPQYLVDPGVRPIHELV